MSETAGAVRVLPFRVRPLPDEPFDSWLEASVAANRATVAEMACALGLVEQDRGALDVAEGWYRKALAIYKQLGLGQAWH